ncbi:MAG: DUF4926 domain-containing protein [Phycisphaerales bacterium]
MPLQEHDTVILTVDLPQHRLRAGDIATIVHIHDNGAGYEIELTTLAGQSIAIVTVTGNQIRAVEPSEVAAARRLIA